MFLILSIRKSLTDVSSLLTISHLSALPTVLQILVPVHHGHGRRSSISIFMNVVTICIMALHVGVYARNNFQSARLQPRATITQLEQAISIDVTVPGSWKIKPGQYIHLSIIRHGLHFRRHHVIWWNRVGNKLVLQLLVEQPVRISNELSQYTDYPMFAFVIGPHGRSFELSKYDSFLLIGEGLDIAGQLCILKSICEIIFRGLNPVMKIVIQWQITETYQIDILRHCLHTIRGNRKACQLISLTIGACHQAHKSSIATSMSTIGISALELNQEIDIADATSTFVEVGSAPLFAVGGSKPLIDSVKHYIILHKLDNVTVEETGFNK